MDSNYCCTPLELRPEQLALAEFLDLALGQCWAARSQPIHPKALEDQFCAADFRSPMHRYSTRHSARKDHFGHTAPSSGHSPGNACSASHQTFRTTGPVSAGSAAVRPAPPSAPLPQGWRRRAPHPTPAHLPLGVDDDAWRVQVIGVDGKHLRACARHRPRRFTPPSPTSPDSAACPRPSRGRRRCGTPAAAAAPRAGWG